MTAFLTWLLTGFVAIMLFLGRVAVWVPKMAWKGFKKLIERSKEDNV